MISTTTTPTKNKESILTEASLFGLSWIGDRATIKRMPLVNMLAMCGKVAPVVVSICDCTSHMVEGRKKDAEFIIKYFSDKVDKFDPSGTLTDCFFFDGAANVQKVGAILCAKYSRAMSFH